MKPAMKRWTLFSVALVAAVLPATLGAEAKAPPAQTIPAPTAPDRITVDARDADARALLKLIFDETRQDYSLDTGFQGYVTLKATDQPLDTMVRLVTRGAMVPSTYTHENKVWFVKAKAAEAEKVKLIGTTPLSRPVEPRTVYEVPRRVAAIVLSPGREAGILINGPEDSPDARTRTVRVGDKVPSGLAGIEPLEVVSINAKGIMLARTGNDPVEFLVPLKASYSPFADKQAEKY